MDIETIVKAVGGAGEAAKLTGIKRQTIESWCVAGRFPDWRADAVANLAKIAARKKPRAEQSAGRK